MISFMGVFEVLELRRPVMQSSERASELNYYTDCLQPQQRSSTRPWTIATLILLKFHLNDRKLI
jgi:hypothetical protein